MKTNLALFLLGVGLAASLRAQAPAPVAIQYAPGSLEQLVSPIALYPDALIALILPASTASTDVVLAARYLEQNGNPALVDNQPWNPSVTALAHYPDIIRWMDANLAWTQDLGQAYSLQPAAVMQAIQTMRSRALAAGGLQSSAQQTVLVTNNIIEIVPAQPNFIYVPYYDPAVVYVSGPRFGPPLIRFGLALSVGPWLHFECDWRDHRVRSRPWVPNRDRGRDVRPVPAGRPAPLPPVIRRAPDRTQIVPRPNTPPRPVRVAPTRPSPAAVNPHPRPEARPDSRANQTRERDRRHDEARSAPARRVLNRNQVAVQRPAATASVAPRRERAPQPVVTAQSRPTPSHVAPSRQAARPAPVRAASHPARNDDARHPGDPAER